jgi:ribosome-associated toxin RatA of RatAB toxin-antitoxin module
LEIRRSVLVPYSAFDMFDLVEQAEHYPLFLPWCVGVHILERSEDWVAARVEFSYLKFRFGFQTRNPKQRPERLAVQMVDGAFKRLHGEWTFTPLGDLGCRVNFFLAYEIADGLFDAIARPAADLVTRAMVEAFIQRARATLTELAPAQAAPAAPVQAAVPVAPAASDASTPAPMPPAAPPTATP